MNSIILRLYIWINGDNLNKLLEIIKKIVKMGNFPKILLMDALFVVCVLLSFQSTG